MPKEASDSKQGRSGIASARVTSDFPKHSLEYALRVAQALEDKNGGQPLPPIDMAGAIGMSPGSSEFRVILSSSIKYGLTTGSFNSERVGLEELGRNIVEATGEDARRNALLQAALTPPTFKSIYQQFRGKKLPESVFFENTIAREFNVPRVHTKKCVEIFTENAEFVGLVRALPTGKWLSTESAGQPPRETGAETDPEVEFDAGSNQSEQKPTVLPAMAGQKAAAAAVATGKPKVFIAHGKNAQVVNQLKDVLTFGNFEPVVAEEYETAAKSIPDKVLDLMRGCSAGIIHVASEEELLDKSGTPHHRLNENVLIEIGASMALYGRKFILLVQKGLHLPSNLSGLYLCYYEGDKLDYEATMKLLKAFADFRTN